MKRILVLAITLFLPLCITRNVVAQDTSERAQARTSLFDAIETGDRRAALKLLSSPQHIDLNHREPGDGKTFLIEAIRADQPQIVR